MPLRQKCPQQFHLLFTNRHVHYGHARARKENRHHGAKYQTAAAHKHWEESRTQQAGETLVQNKTPSCIQVALLKSVTQEGQDWGVTCLALPSLQPSDSWRACSVPLGDTISWVLQCFCWHHEPLVISTDTQHWKASLCEQR